MKIFRIPINKCVIDAPKIWEKLSKSKILTLQTLVFAGFIQGVVDKWYR